MLLVSAALLAGPGKAGYDPEADPAADLAAAVQTAQKEGKRILLEVGGEWCSWCHLLEKFLDENSAIDQALHDRYVVVKVNYSKENKNEAFLGQYPEIAGYPHIFVLDSDGKLLHSQNTAELEEGKGYNADAVMAFIRQWSGRTTDRAASAKAAAE